MTLWEEKAEDFQLSLSGTGGGSVFAVVTGLLAKKFAGKDLHHILFYYILLINSKLVITMLPTSLPNLNNDHVVR